jgi:hypothetical protein
MKSCFERAAISRLRADTIIAKGHCKCSWRGLQPRTSLNLYDDAVRIFYGVIEHHSNLTALSPDHSAWTVSISIQGQKKYEPVRGAVDLKHGALLRDIAQLSLQIGNPTGVGNLASWTRATFA